MIPGAYDSITAHLIEAAGFDALYITGSGVSLSLLGQPDLNTVSYLELRQVVQNIASTVKIPMVVDIDTGFGAPLNIIRLVRDFEALDIAAVQIEDQMMPKKCGHEMGRVVVSAEEMQARIRTIVDTREENGLVVIARTDARTVWGLEDAIRRGNLYLEAGADVIFIESPESVEEVKMIARSVRGPVLFNNVEGGRSPFLSRTQLEDAGIRMSIYPNSLTRVITKNCQELLNELKQQGTTESLWGNMLSHKEVWKLFDYEKWVTLENKYMLKK